MLDRIFPRQIDNNLRGHWIALLLFGFYVFGRLGMGAIRLRHLFDRGDRRRAAYGQL
jgi:hypothetical protein